MDYDEATRLAAVPYRTDTCEVCLTPIVANAPRLTGVCHSRRLAYQGHRGCVEAWLNGDTDTLAKVRSAACAAGYHEAPQDSHTPWTRDPDDPYGDAVFWECVRGCGHVQRHPGYGHGRWILEHLGAAEHTAWLNEQR